MIDESKEIVNRGPGRRNGRVLFTMGEPEKRIAVRPNGPSVAQVRGEGRTIRVSPLEKSLLETLNKDEVNRIAFDKNPIEVAYNVIYQPKPRFIAEWLLKRMSHQDDLVAAIVQTRANQIRSFGVPRPNRHSNGFVIEPIEGVVDNLDDDKKAILDRRIERARDLLETCGRTENVPVRERQSFADFLYLLTQNAIVVGKVAVEKIRDKGGRVHSFRHTDAGTIFPATSYQTSGPSIRKQALSLLARLKNKKESELAEELDLQRWIKDEYSWVQVIETTPRQVFTDDQMICRNFYQVPDVEMMGHPIAPLDTVLAAVTTHMNITTMSRVYFQSGRAAKGMLIVQSDDADDDTIKYMQEHFQANINNASNSFRLPVFAIGPKDTITWQPIEQQGSRDMEFQYLSDAVARIIMSAFQISPDELPGWSYLSKGTASQTLSEGSNEYKLEAHRDLGIRPLISHIEELLNEEIFPIIDEDLSKICRIRLTGLDAESAEKEANRLAEDSPIHMTMNQINEKVEKDPLPAALGGDVPLNPAFHTLVLDKYVTVGVICEYLLGMKGASKDPTLAYVNNPIWIQFQGMLLQEKQLQQQAQAQAQQVQAQAAAQPAPANSGPQGKPGAQEAERPGVGDQQPRAAQKAERLSAGARLAIEALTKNEDGLVDLDKSESQLQPHQRRVLAHHRKLVEDVVEEFRKDSEKTQNEIVASVDALLRGGG